MIIDPTSNVGKIRLRIGDYSEFPFFPDEVYLSALEDSNNSVPKASQLMATYMLALLTSQSHQKLAHIEVYGAEHFQNYLKFVRLIVLNPNFMDLSPMPYVAQVVNEYGEVVELPLVQFQKDWNANYTSLTQSQDMHLTAYATYNGILTDPFGM